MGEFGEKLRKQREQRGITLEAVSNTTKIGTRMLKALEDERFDQLPGGVFNKGFVRAYARQIGLDAEEAVNDYLAALRESQIQAQAIMPDFRSAHLESAEQFEAATAPGNEISGTDPHLEVQKKEVQKKEVREDVRRDEDHAPPPDVHREAARQKEEPRPAAPEVPKQKAVEPVAEERPPRKLIGERPAQPKSQPAMRIPWGIVAAGLLVVALLLAFLSYHPRREQRAEQKAEQDDQRAK
ncbi:MAG: helix-turn-helix transcriptional regulator, partial [Candidatus Sulfotelmatobacter sp.]